MFELTELPNFTETIGVSIRDSDHQEFTKLEPSFSAKGVVVGRCTPDKQGLSEFDELNILDWADANEPKPMLIWRLYGPHMSGCGYMIKTTTLNFVLVLPPSYI